MNSTDRLPCQRVRACPSNPNVPVTAGQSFAFLRASMFRMNEVESSILSGPADPLARGKIIAFHEGFFAGSDELGIPPDLNASLMLLYNRQTPALFLFGDVIFE